MPEFQIGVPVQPDNNNGGDLLEWGHRLLRLWVEREERENDTNATINRVLWFMTIFMVLLYFTLRSFFFSYLEPGIREFDRLTEELQQNREAMDSAINRMEQLKCGTGGIAQSVSCVNPIGGGNPTTELLKHASPAGTVALSTAYAGLRGLHHKIYD